jgi:hypothetical protein
LKQRASKQAAWYDYLNPVNYVTPGGPSQASAERTRGNKLDAEIVKQRKTRKPGGATVDNINTQLDKSKAGTKPLTAGSFRQGG